MLTRRALRALGGLSVMALLAYLAVVADTPRLLQVPVGWRAVWSVAADLDPEDVVGHAHPKVSDHALVVATRRGAIAVHNPQTGDLRYTIAPDPTLPRIAGMWIATGTLVVSRAVPDRDDRVLSGYNLATGAALWQRTVAISGDDPTKTGHVGTYTGPDVLVNRRDIVVFQRSSEPIEMQVLDPRTGTTRARMTYPRRCDLDATVAERSVVLLDYCEGGGLRLASMDPATLRPRWTRELPSPVNESRLTDLLHRVTIDAEGFVHVRIEGTASIYTPDGRLLTTANKAFLVPRTPGSRQQARGVDPVTGRVRWTRPSYFESSTVVARGRSVYLSDGWPSPVFLISLDAGTGDLNGFPLDIPHRSQPALLGTTDDLALVYVPAGDHDGSGRVTAYRMAYGASAGPASLGGIEPGAWPDACALLTDGDLKVIADGYFASPHARVLGDVALPNPAACDWIPSVDEGVTVSASIMWVASSNGDAQKLFADEVALAKQRDTFDPTSESSQIFQYTEGSPAGGLGAALVNVGPVIVKLTATSRLAVRLLAPLLRDNLLARYPQRAGASVAAPASRVRWSYPTDNGIHSSAVVSAGVVYVASGGRVYALDAVTGKALWSHPAADDTMLVSGGVVYVAGFDGRVYALDAVTGKERWSPRIDESVLSVPVVSGGMVYVGSKNNPAASRDYSVYALDAVTGKVRWSHRIDAPVFSDPVVSGGVVYVGCEDGRVYALDAASGEVRWSRRVGGWVASLVVSGGTVYAGSFDNSVYAFDAASGKVRWSYRTNDAVEAPPVVSGGMVYVGSRDNSLYALDAVTGEVRWSYWIGGWVSAPVVSDGVVYVGSRDNSVYALDAATGKERWSYWTDGWASAPVVSGGVVYVSSWDDSVYALNAASGKVRWSYRTGGAVGAPPVVSGGMVYVGGWDGNVYALDAR
ncbi:PQQ-binding-like beta-propeller repeat protein [Microbispora sp. H13382]|uniref:outer membrane protein assembly factor BamB family protein n=1 Tax=Microbispora sp. H13382 TaxID=2729112 RepID=UPI001601C753|nr:PQQ-binding-like beta-propeller repeat protein [Microbispora sp. H13382]